MRDWTRVSPDGTYKLTDEERELCERVAARYQDLPSISAGRLGASFVTSHENDDIGRLAWMEALGLDRISLVEATFTALANATASRGKVNERELNVAIDLVAGLKPVNTAQLMFATQIVTIHLAFNHVSAVAASTTLDLEYDWSTKMMTRMAKVLAIQIDGYRRLQSKPAQTIRVEHVHLHQGSASPASEGGGAILEGQPHVRSISERTAVYSDIEAVQAPLPGAGGAGVQGVSIPRGSRRSRRGP